MRWFESYIIRMIAKFEDWTSETGYLYISKYGITPEKKIFVELSRYESSAKNFKSLKSIENLIDKVNILCIVSGGRLLDNDAKDIMKSYLICER